GYRISKRSPVSGEAFRGLAQHATREVVERRRDVLRAAAKVARLAGKAGIDGPNRTYRSRPKLHFRGALEVEREDSCALDRVGRSEQPMVREEHGGLVAQCFGDDASFLVVDRHEIGRASWRE